MLHNELFNKKINKSFFQRGRSSPKSQLIESQYKSSELVSLFHLTTCHFSENVNESTFKLFYNHILELCSIFHPGITSRNCKLVMFIFGFFCSTTFLNNNNPWDGCFMSPWQFSLRFRSVIVPLHIFGHTWAHTALRSPKLCGQKICLLDDIKLGYTFSNIQWHRAITVNLSAEK